MIKATSEYNLKVINPLLADEWHPNKNKKLKTFQVTPGSKQKAWWKCENGHSWEAKISNRNNGNGCPYCSGRLVCKDNCLKFKFPKLAKEWHSELNGELTASEVTPGMKKKIWWKCKNQHVWSARICDRSSGRGCLKCRLKQS